MPDPLALDASHRSVDATLVSRIVGAEGTVGCPYAHVGTLVAKLRTLFPFLVDVARERACTDHGTVARECGIHAARQTAVLRILGRHEAEHGRPPLPALVTTADRETPGEWYFDLVARTAGRPHDVPDAPDERRWCWETQRDAVYRTWTTEGRSARTAEFANPVP